MREILGWACFAVAVMLVGVPVVRSLSLAEWDWVQTFASYDIWFASGSVIFLFLGIAVYPIDNKKL